jgi:hypothetical protein
MTVKLKPDSSEMNIWNYKPWWCQPWSIILTGIAIVGGSWLLTKTVWIVVGIAIPILLWWIYFLILYPKMMENSNVD